MAKVLADIEIIQARSYTLQGRTGDTVRTVLQALRRTQALGLKYQEAGLQINFGAARSDSGRCDEAIPFYERSARLAGPDALPLYSTALTSLSGCYARLGEFDRAIWTLTAVVSLDEHSGPRGVLESALGGLGRALLMQGDLRAAATYLERALAIANESNVSPQAHDWASALSNMYLELGELDNAEAANRESMRLVERNAGEHNFSDNELNSAGIAAARKQVPDAVRLFHQAIKDAGNEPAIVWAAEEGLGRLAEAEGHPAEALPHYEAAVTLVEATQAKQDRTDFQLPFLTRQIRLYRFYVDALLRQGEIERALAVADSSRARVLSARSNLPPVRRLPPGAFRDLAAKTNSVILSYWLDAKQSHVWLVSAREIHHIELPPAADIKRLVEDYQEAIERNQADPARTRLPAGDRLFATLIAPVRQWIPAGSNVIVTPDGVLHGLNLESLPVPGDTPRYWIEDVTISIAPSLALLRRTAPTSAPRRLLLVGNPTGVDHTYPELKYAAPEIASVTASFRGAAPAIVTGSNATPQSYLESHPEAFSDIHFTAHALANRESPLDSSVLLTGGKLYARDVMAAPLTADLVTVSACRGAISRLYSGEGMVGFAWAFLHAGARHVIAGLWAVNDQSTSNLMETLYRELAAGKTPAQALRIAKLRLLESQGNFRKPYYWAPFQVYTVTSTM